MALVDSRNVDDPDLEGHGVDHQAVVEGLRCKALRVTDPGKIGAALAQVLALARAHRVQVEVEVEVIPEKVTHIAMGTEIDNVNEFQHIECLHRGGREGLVAAGLLE